MNFAFSQIDPDTQGSVSKIPTPLSDYLGASWDQGKHDDAFSSIMRMRQYSLEAGDDGSRMMEPGEATYQYGIPGKLKFDQPVRESVAQLMKQRKQDEVDRDFILQNGSSLARMIPGMAASFVAGMSNPLDLGMLFIPIVGEEKLAASAAVLGRGTLRQFIARGAISTESIARLGIPAPRLVSSMIQGSIGQGMFEIPNALSTIQEGGKYTPKMFMTNVVAGGIFAGAIHMGISGASRLYERLRPETKEAMLRKALSDTLEGKDVDVESLAKVDESAIRGQAVENHMNALAEAWKGVDMKDVEAKVRERYGETVASIAMRGPNGEVVKGGPGQIHGMLESRIAEEMEQKKLPYNPADWEPGFVTDTGRFVGRTEAMVMSGLHEPMHSDHLSGIGVGEEFTLEELVHEGYSNSEARQIIASSRAERRETSLREDPRFQRQVAAERDRRVQEAIDKLKNPKQNSVDRIDHSPILKPVEVQQHTHEVVPKNSEEAAIQKDIDGLKEANKPENTKDDRGVFQKAIDNIEKRIKELSDPQKYTGPSGPETGATTLLDLVSRPIARGMLIVVREMLRAGKSIAEAVDMAMQYLKSKKIENPKVREALLKEIGALDKERKLPKEEFQSLSRQLNDLKHRRGDWTVREGKNIPQGKKLTPQEISDIPKLEELLNEQNAIQVREDMRKDLDQYQGLTDKELFEKIRKDSIQTSVELWKSDLSLGEPIKVTEDQFKQLTEEHQMPDNLEEMLEGRVPSDQEVREYVKQQESEFETPQGKKFLREQFVKMKSFLNDIPELKEVRDRIREMDSMNPHPEAIDTALECILKKIA